MNTLAYLVKPKKKSLKSFTSKVKYYSVKLTNSNNKKQRKTKNSPDGLMSECEHILKVLKSERKANNDISKDNIELVEAATVVEEGKNISTVEQSPRINEVNIQMLSNSLYQQIFKQKNQEKLLSPELIKKAQDELNKHGLLKENVEILKDVNLNIPPFVGANIEEHFWNIGEKQSGSYKTIVNQFIKAAIPKIPEKWLCKPGWTKYVEGEEPKSVPFPEENALVFDVEVCMKQGDLPTLATAVSEKAWYGWVSSDLTEGLNPLPTRHYNTDKLIPFEGNAVPKEAPRIVVGHNVSYDRARIKEQYYLVNSGIRFIDTMSLHICIGGTTKNLKGISSYRKQIEDADLDALKTSCLSSLKDIYALYCNKELSKDPRDFFTKGTLQDIRNEFDNLMEYCAVDVRSTYEVLQVIFPVFLKRFPHPVTFAGMLEMGTAILPVNKNWEKFIADSDQTYEDLYNEINFSLAKKCDSACRLLHNDEYKSDIWMWSEDWKTQKLKLTKKKLKKKTPEELKEKVSTDECDDEELEKLTQKFQYLFDLKEILPKVKPFLPGYPLWYRKLCEKKDNEDWVPDPHLLTMNMLVTPKLLNLTWENFPLHHVKNFGWGILVADVNAQNFETSMPFEKILQLTKKNCNINELVLNSQKNGKKKKNYKSEAPVPYYEGAGIWCNHIIDDCCYFFKLPHKDGPSKNVGSPLSKDFTQLFSISSLISSDSNSLAKKVLDLGHKISYWRNNRERVLEQMVVWLNSKENKSGGVNEEATVGIIIPKVVVCGTLTRRAKEATWLTASKVTENRIGSELRAMIQAPPGYHFIGADVDSQELWIASLIGDSYAAKIHGFTPLGWMTLSGTKANETDMHSVTAKAAGISRQNAKVINYARIYGAGIPLAQKLLKQFNPSMSYDEAKAKAKIMYALTKGKRLYRVKESALSSVIGIFGADAEVYDMGTAYRVAIRLGKKMDEVFEKAEWVGGTESAMFNQLENMSKTSVPVTPFLQCRLSRALEPKYKGDESFLNTRINWIVQSGAVDFLHLMLVCMKWLTNGRARYSFSFHDEIRYLIPSDERYHGALALHITNLLVRAFCSHRLGMYDLPQSVAFFSSVEIDKALRKEANDDCITPSNPHGLEKGYGISLGESLNIYDVIEKTGGNLAPFSIRKQVHFFVPSKTSLSRFLLVP